MFTALGVPVLTVVGGGLVLGAGTLAPLALMALSARIGRQRLAAVFGMLGVLLYGSLVLLGFLAPYDGYPLLEQIVRVLMCYAATGVLVGAAVATLGAARALWGAEDGPSRLGPRAPAPEELVAGTSAATGLGGEARRQIPTTRLMPSTC